MLIQSVLFFILGVAATTLVLILLAPAIWRRALYLARKVLASEVPMSLTEIEADRDFLRARHAVELVDRDEKFARLAEKFDNQKREFDHVKEQLFRLSDAEHRATALAEQLSEKSEELDNEKCVVETFKKNEGKTVDEIRDLVIEERHARMIEKTRENELLELHKEVARLNEQLELSQEAARANKVKKAEMNGLREEIMDMAAKFAATTAIKEGASSPIVELVENARGKKSLAARIKKDLAEKPKKPAARRKNASAKSSGKNSGTKSDSKTKRSKSRTN
ncbi:hypothetical protein [uncultured Bartonella sp.]|uniref:hypothetical protein n=1 Tax=uncultured Bartonella sp. TaxID=104108 RepID=UPI0025D4E96D|nr:hypothetical protein [uncultured Bartonella sp.]